MSSDPNDPMGTWTHSGFHCPNCGMTTDALSTAWNPQHVPRSGDYSWCVYCQEPSIFVISQAFGTVSARTPTPMEYAQYLIDHGDSHETAVQALGFIKKKFGDSDKEAQ